MAEKLVSLVDANRVEFWLVDKPQGYLDVVKRSRELIEIHSGVDESLSYMPIDDSRFLENIKASLSKVETLI